jgi:2,4-dienoyl-CoA reductase-like NADH-dependent reductase (Old Yellow Enzyme family)/NADPH-dependent 2,4-dienoyl-CoA reductase/sulfur reductase-like enzyme
VTEEFVRFTASMARGGAGIVTVGDSPINQEYADCNHFVINLANPFIVHGLVRITDAIHRYGALASIELNLRSEVLPHEMSREQIWQIIQDFAQSAERCYKGGFDMVMLHGGHGHLVSTFYSPNLNHRNDEYGTATMDNRCRFANQLIDAVRGSIGPEMAIEWRISADELTCDGVGIEDALMFAKAIQHKIDLIHVSVGNMTVPETIERVIQPTYLPQATNLAYAARFKQELDIPVTTVGSFTMELAQQALAQGKADMVAMIRSFIADPDQVNKAGRHQADRIRPCIRCCICTGDDPHGCPKPLRCSVNAQAGRNNDFDEIELAQTARKVVIIGGGCAGLEAARRAACRGHQVVLFEASSELGGSLRTASANPIKADLRRYLEWSVAEVQRIAAIVVRLNTPATIEAIAAQQPEALIIAIGGEQIIPRLPGISSPKVALAVDADLGVIQVGKQVVLVGAGLTGTETAVYLAQNGHQVTLLDMRTIAEIDATPDTSALISGTLRKMAAEAGVQVLEQRRLLAVTESGIVVAADNGAEQELVCDTVLLSVGVKPKALSVAGLEQFQALAAQTFLVGDCNGKAGNITKAVREAFYAAMNIV